MDFKNHIKGFYKIKKDNYNKLAQRRFYLFSRLMDFKLVPPTSILMCNTIQLYIKEAEGDKLKFLENLSDSQKTDIFIFYFLFGYLDPNMGNIMFGKDCNMPALIDKVHGNLS